MNECIARALVFSGRPDPTWKIEEPIVKELEKIWDSLVAMHGEPPSASPLGYRGCLIKCKSDIEWFVYKNLVTLKRSGKTESRDDDYRLFEKLVLSSAPEGLVPPSLIENNCGQVNNSVT